jgi:hypothetical protein
VLHPANLIVRGWPLTIDALMDNADSTRSRYSYQGEPFAAVSAEATVAGWDLASILSGRRLRTRRRYAQVTTRELITAGFTLLPTFSLPHYSIVLGAYTENETERLLVALGPVHDNPHHVRRPK